MWAKRYSMKKRKTVCDKTRDDMRDTWVRSDSHTVRSRRAGEKRTGGSAQVGVTLGLVEAEVGVLVNSVARHALYCR
jgi:hypothetical protein